jgi:hypothetical protein
MAAVTLCCCRTCMGRWGISNYADKVAGATWAAAAAGAAPASWTVLQPASPAAAGIMISLVASSSPLTSTLLSAAAHCTLAGCIPVWNALLTPAISPAVCSQAITTSCIPTEQRDISRMHLSGVSLQIHTAHNQTRAWPLLSRSRAGSMCDRVGGAQVEQLSPYRQEPSSCLVVVTTRCCVLVLAPSAVAFLHAEHLSSTLQP